MSCLKSYHLRQYRHVHLHKPTRSIRSPYTQLVALPVPRQWRHNLSFGSRAFRISD